MASTTSSASTSVPSSSTKVNLLDLAASAIAATVVAADQITSLCKPGLEDAKNIRLKNDGSFVTDADIAAQGIIVQTLLTVSSDIRLVGEESEEEMAAQNITGHEERAEEIFRLAQEEIHIRYNGSTAPLPLAQSSRQEEEEKGSSQSVPSEDGPQNKTLPSGMEEYEVDSSRVSVFIDPLDGTKAYTRGDYEPVSVLIAIILDEQPCFGIICKPFGHSGGETSILDTGCVALYGGTLLGAVYTAGGPQLNCQPDEGQLPRAVISSSRSQGIVEEFVRNLGEKGMIHPEPMMISGAGEKSLRIILRSNNEGLWFFPKPGTSLWDVAASDALLRASGGKLTDKHGKDLDYTKSKDEAENLDGIIACYDRSLHEECIRLFQEGEWNES